MISHRKYEIWCWVFTIRSDPAPWGPPRTQMVQYDMRETDGRCEANCKVPFDLERFREIWGLENLDYGWLWMEPLSLREEQKLWLVSLYVVICGSLSRFVHAWRSQACCTHVEPSDLQPGPLLLSDLLTKQASDQQFHLTHIAHWWWCVVFAYMGERW